jgi:hypothetical protein
MPKYVNRHCSITAPKDSIVDSCLQYETLISTMKQWIDSWKDRYLSLHDYVLYFNVCAFKSVVYRACGIDSEAYVATSQRIIE